MFHASAYRVRRLTKADPVPAFGEGEDATRVRGVESALRLQGWGLRDDDPHRPLFLALFAFGVASAFAATTGRVNASRSALARQTHAALAVARAEMLSNANALARAFALGDSVEVRELIRDVSRALETALVDAYAPGDRAAATLYRSLARPAGLAEARTALAGTRLAPLLDAAEAQAMAWARGRAVTAARMVADESRRALSALVERATKEGWTAAQLEKRLPMHAGLTRAQSASLERQRAALAKEGLSPSRIDRRLSAQANRLRRVRAANIAEHEAHLAVQTGQVELWEEAARLRLIDAGALVQVWVTSSGERTCPYCSSLDGKWVSIGGVYRADGGKAGMLQGRAPPIHLRCRCVLVLALRSDVV